MFNYEKMLLVIIFLGIIASCRNEELPIQSESSITQTNFASESCSIEKAFANTERTLVELQSGYVVEQIVRSNLSVSNESSDTIYVFGADVLLSKEQVELLNSQTRSALTTDFVRLWPGGVVRFRIDESIDNPDIFYSAVNHWESVTSLDFIEISGESGDYIDVISDDGCYSYIGKVGGRQALSLGEGCSVGNAIHEIGHAIGLFHEHARMDRDLHIIVHYGNIKPKYRYAFDKYSLNYEGDDHGPIDFSSVMMYGSTDFAISSSHPSMMRINGRPIVKQRQALSDGDIAGVRYLYGPSFAKIEKVPVDVNEEVHPMWDTYEVIYDVVISFYSDKNFTTPCATDSNRLLHISCTETTLGGTTSNIYQINVPSGVTTYSLGTTRLYERNDMGNLSEYYYKEYSLIGAGI